MIEIPPDALPHEILAALLEEFITREGTDYGDHELTLAEKVSRLKPQISRGDVLILFDTDSEQVHIMTRRDWLQRQSAVTE
jgi:uncharacterized protein